MTGERPTIRPGATGAPLDVQLEPALDEAEAARIWQRVREAQVARRQRRWWPYATAAGLAVAIALAAWWMRPSTVATRSAGAGPLAGEVALEAGARLGGEDGRAVAMADGSRVVLAARAELEVLANEGDKFVTAVRRGRARFEVRPGGPRRWVVETDLATVEVVGTVFAVDRGEGGLTVAVERGVVLVRGERVPGRVVRLTAGERVEVALTSAAGAVTPTMPPASAGASPDASPALAPSAPTSIASAPTSIASAPTAITSAPTSIASAPTAITNAPTPIAPTAPTSITGAAAPSPGAPAPIAIDPATTASAPAPATSSSPSSAIIAAADERLAAGDPAGAARLLDAHLAGAPADAGAGLAAFLLGRVALDSLGDPDRAAAAFARVLAIGSPRAVQEEALARRALALARAGRTADATDAARAYLARYPAGARAAQMHALASP